MDLINWLEDWYSSQCDGGWEHELGVEITTLDNPGWSVFIDLANTPLEFRKFDKVEYNKSETDWLMCHVKDARFESAGAPGKLKEILQVFRNWAESDQ